MCPRPLVHPPFPFSVFFSPTPPLILLWADVEPPCVILFQSLPLCPRSYSWLPYYLDFLNWILDCLLNIFVLPFSSFFSPFIFAGRPYIQPPTPALSRCPRVVFCPHLDPYPPFFLTWTPRAAQRIPQALVATWIFEPFFFLFFFSSFSRGGLFPPSFWLSW